MNFLVLFIVFTQFGTLERHHYIFYKSQCEVKTCEMGFKIFVTAIFYIQSLFSDDFLNIFSIVLTH